MLDELDIVNSNLAEAMETWAVCQKEIEAMQPAVEDVGDTGLLHTACGVGLTDTTVQQSYDTAVLETLQQCAKLVENIASEPSTSESLSLAVDVRELEDRSDKSSLKSAASSARLQRNNSATTRRLSGPKHQSASTPESKNVVGVAGKSPQKTESPSAAGKKVGSSSNVITRQSSLTSRRSVDLSSSRSSAPLSSRVSSSPADSTTRRPSVPKRTVKQPTVTGDSKQQSLTPRKSSAASVSSCTLLPGQKTTSESSLAAGDFTGDLPSVTSLRSSTPLTSSVGDSNDPDSISRVSSVSDASSLSASHGSSGAFQASVFRTPKPSTSTGE